MRINKNICLILTVALIMSLVLGTTVYANGGVLISAPEDEVLATENNELIENETCENEILDNADEVLSLHCVRLGVERKQNGVVVKESQNKYLKYYLK